MSRKAMLVAMLAVSLGLYAQRSGGAGGTASTPPAGAPTQPGTPTTQGAVGGASGQAAAGQTQTPSANTAGTPTLPEAMAGPAGTTGTTQANPSNLNTNTNGVTTGTFGGGFAATPLLATPTATFDAPLPTAGITDAGRAGISSNMPVNTGVASTLASPTMVYTAVPPVNVVVVNPAVGAPSATGAAAGTSGRLINDMGPSYYSDAMPAGSNVSLGQVAAQFKASKAAVNARMLTNDDVQKMVSSKTGVTVAKNMPPLGPGAVPQNTTPQQASSQTVTQAQSASQSAQSSAAAAGQQSQTGSAGQRAGTPPPAETSQGQTQGAEAAAGATTPQINRTQQSNDTQGKSKLPATSTLLPLLGLLGAVSGGLGLWFRKFRK